MKKYYFTIIAFIFLATANAQIINFPDANFKAKLLAADVTNQIARNLIGDYFKIDSNSDGEIQFTEALQVASLYVDNSDISSLAGIEFFTAIVILNCFGNQLINLNLTSNIALIYLSCSFNQLTDLNISNNARIRELDCANNQLTSLNLSTNIDLTRVFCENNLLSNLNITNCSLLNELYCNNNQLTNLNLTSNISLNSLRCYNNQLSILIINNNVELNNLDCSNNLISVLDLINNLSLQTLDCKNNQLTNLNTSYNKSLFSLDCSNNLLTNLNLNNNTDLITLYCTNNLLETLLVKNGRNENTLVVLQNNPNLRFICADLGQVTEIQSYINALGLTAFCNVNDYCTFAPGGTNYTILVDNKVDANINGCDIFDIPLANLKYTVTNITNSGSLISNSSGNFSIPVQEGTTTITPILQNPSYFNVSPTSLSVTFPATANTVIQNFCITPTNLEPAEKLILNFNKN